MRLRGAFRFKDYPKVLRVSPNSSDGEILALADIFTAAVFLSSGKAEASGEVLIVDYYGQRHRQISMSYLNVSGTEIWTAVTTA
jgi:hypothetical protein